MDQGASLDRDELRFLYEIDTGKGLFGYRVHPRFGELRARRDAREDAPVVLDCRPEEIAWGRKDVTENTKAYIGPIFPGIFENENLEHLYTSFPEGRIERRTLQIGGRTPKEYEADLDKEGHYTAKDILDKMTPSKERHEAEIVRLKVSDLGFTKATRYDELQKRAKELGLDLAPAEAGPELRLAMNQQKDDWFRVAMEPITDRDGNPCIFYVGRNEVGSWLGRDVGSPDGRWNPDNSFAFVPRKQSLDT